MKSFISTLAVLVALATLTFSAPVSAAIPVCVLGGPTAMDTNRQLDEGETFVKTDRPLVVNLQFRPTKEHPEQVGECMLPSGNTVAVKNNILQWVKKCGNDEVNKNIFVIPFTPLKGLDGKDGLPGRDGKDGRDGLPGKNFDLVPGGKYHGWCGVWTDLGCTVLAGAVVGGTVYLATRDNGDDGVPPDADTGGAFLRAGITFRGRVIPPSHGRGGGLFLGGSVSFK